MSYQPGSASARREARNRDQRVHAGVARHRLRDRRPRADRRGPVLELVLRRGREVEHSHQPRRGTDRMVTHPRCRVRGRNLERGHAGPVPEALRVELRSGDRADPGDQRPGAEMAADALAARPADEAADLVAEAGQLELLQLGVPGLLVFLLRDREQPLERAAVLGHARDRVRELEHFLRVDRTGRPLGAELHAGGAAALDAEVDADQVAAIRDPHPLERRLEPRRRRRRRGRRTPRRMPSRPPASFSAAAAISRNSSSGSGSNDCSLMLTPPDAGIEQIARAVGAAAVPTGPGSGRVGQVKL